MPEAGQEPSPAEAEGGDDNEDDDFGDFADAEPATPAWQPDAEAPRPSSASHPAASQQLPVPNGPLRSPLHPAAAPVGGFANGPLFVTAFPDSQPAPTALHPSGSPGSTAAQPNDSGGQTGMLSVSDPAAAAVHPLQQDTSAAETSADDSFADFGSFAEAIGDGGSSGALWQRVDASRQGPASISRVVPAPSPGVDKTAKLGSWSAVTAHAPAEQLQHRRGVSRCVVRDMARHVRSALCSWFLSEPHARRLMGLRTSWAIKC